MTLMIILSVLYPKTAESKFDVDYYLGTHIPLVRSRWSGMGLQKVDITHGTAALDGGMPGYELIGQLTFESEESLSRALRQYGNEIISDIPKFTNVQPIIQTGKVLPV
jgi:uncharacterized protein (TIGR02118 family)